MGEGIVKRGNEDGRGRLLERGRDGHRRRERRREAERAVRVLVVVTVHLAVEPAPREGRGEDAADPGLVLVVALPERPGAALRREAWFL